MTRWEWKLPSDTALSKRHPLTAEPFWSFVLRRAGVPVYGSATLSGSNGVVEHNWQLFLELLGWWEVKRCFNRSGDSVALKPVADIVVIHPVGRFTQASTDAQWRDACVWTLLAHCNHGGTCKDTFRDADDLATFSDDSVAELMERFATAAPAERLGARLAPCPPHIAKAWHLGVARRKRAEEKKHSTSRVASAIAPVKYIFVEEAADWRQKMWEAMAAPDQEEATEAWRKAELRPVSDSAEVRDEAAVLEDDENEKIREAMVAFIRKDLKWTHRELHDALLVARVAVPPTPSMQNYISALYAQYGSADAGFLPQNFQSHAPREAQAAEHPPHTQPHGFETRREDLRQEGCSCRALGALAQQGTGSRPRGARGRVRRRRRQRRRSRRAPAPAATALDRTRRMCGGDPAECSCDTRTSGERSGQNADHGDGHRLRRRCGRRQRKKKRLSRATK